MFVSHIDAIERTPVSMRGAQNVLRQLVIGPKEGWDDHVMRVFTLQDCGHTPCHRHPWPHINYVIRGTGTVMIDGEEHELKSGSVAFVPAGTEHQFTSTCAEEFVLMCIVPVRGAPAYAG